jgi:hypothetical protein
MGLNLLDEQVTWKNLFKIPAGQTVFCSLNQAGIIDPTHALCLDHILDQPFIFSQQGFQAVRATCLCTNKSNHSLGAANSSNSHTAAHPSGQE